MSWGRGIRAGGGEEEVGEDSSPDAKFLANKNFSPGTKDTPDSKYSSDLKFSA